MPEIPRKTHVAAVERLLTDRRAVLLFGARQVGKTTLAAQVGRRRSGRVTRFDLENPRDVERLANPMLALEGLTGLVILDEIQRRPELFPVLRVLIDRRRPATRFLILGSASPSLLRQGSESLAGRIAYYRLPGFDLEEVGGNRLQRLWQRGGFPRSFFAPSDAKSADWRRDFVQSFVERDLPQLGVTVPARRIQQFWSMLAHYHGQTWNAAEIAGSLGVSQPTVRRYLDLLVDTFVVRRLPPWFENVGKRTFKSSKVYIEDSGLLHTLLDVNSASQLERHPKLGASWEGFAIGVVVRALRARDDQCYFWRTHGGAELDLLVVQGSQRLGFEFKRSDAPKVTKSMRVALDDLRLRRIDVVYPGPKTFDIDKRIRAVALMDVPRLAGRK
jgi:uncharacterized protein